MSTGTLWVTLVRRYFDLTYALLGGSAAGRRFLELTGPPGEAVHGYFTAEDRDVLLEAIGRGPDARLLDLGCGIGGVAIAVHRRSGAAIVGVDNSPRAIAEASERARRAGVEQSVRFVVGDLTRPPRIGATGAYAIDSLMFLPDLAQGLRSIGDGLGNNLPLVAALLVAGRDAGEQLGRVLATAGARVDRAEDVTAQLRATSRRRAHVAGVLLRRRDESLPGRLAMLLILFEEGLVRCAISRGRLSRWRIVVRFGPVPGTR